MAKKEKSYIQKILPFIDRMRTDYVPDDEPQPGPGPQPGGGGGEIDPENPTIVDFSEGTEVLPPDPEQPNVSILSVCSAVSVQNNTLVLGGVSGNTLTL